MKFKTALGYAGNLPVTEGFVREVMTMLSHNELKTYLYILMLCVNKKECELSEISEKLGIDTDELVDIISALEKRKAVKFKSNTVTFLNPENEGVRYGELFDPEDIKDIPRELSEEMQSCFGKLLSNADLNEITALYKSLTIPDDVIMIILKYCESKEIRKISYFARIARDWSEKSIDSAAAAHEYIALTERRNSLYEKVKTELGIYGRDLTASQKKYVDSWEGKFSVDEIREAYECAIDHGASKPFTYANKILTSDKDKPVVDKPSEVTAKVQVKKSRFNNFEQKKTDYEAVKKKNLEKLLKKWEQ